MAKETYLHGHHSSVLRSHTWRTPENSAGYLLDHLARGTSVLDVGCGPATITVGFARRVSPGRVVGIEPTDAGVEVAQRVLGTDAPDNVEFRRADVYALPFDDDSFDVVHAHQVLQHLADPVAALAEMRRVCRPDGVVAARDADYGAMHWFPQLPGLTQWQRVYRDTAYALGAEPDAGRRLKSWFLAAGFDDPTCSADIWCHASNDDVAWWSGLWAERIMSSSIHDEALAHGIATEAELAEISHAWREWGAATDAWFAIPHGEVLAHP